MKMEMEMAPHIFLRKTFSITFTQNLFNMYVVEANGEILVCASSSLMLSAYGGWTNVVLC
jgi:hypothetical protein